MKTYVIMLSKKFPKGHSRSGDETYFKEQVLNVLKNYDGHTIERPEGEPLFINGRKIHTIRGNYKLWESRFNEIYAGNACISVRGWYGKPYRSAQCEIARLTKEDGIGLQKLEFFLGDAAFPEVDGGPANEPTLGEIAKNDGFRDRRYWLDWFRKVDLIEPLAIIHFTKFRY